MSTQPPAHVVSGAQRNADQPLTFHAPDQPTAVVSAPEREWLWGLCVDVATALVPTSLPRVVLRHLNPQHWLYDDFTAAHDRPTTAHSQGWLHIRTLVALYDIAHGGHGPSAFIAGDGRPLPTRDLVANTVLTVGSDPLALAARLSRHAHRHVAVLPEDRPWLADVISGGLDTGLYRPQQGWADAVHLLRHTDRTPAVVSTGHRWPDPETAGYPADRVNPRTGAPDPRERPDDLWQSWREEDPQTQWSMALGQLESRGDIPPLAADCLRAPIGAHADNLVQLTATWPTGQPGQRE